MVYIIRYILTTLATLLFVLLLVPLLLYLPAVQDGARGYVTRLASEQLDMEVSLKSIRLRFPLSLELRDALVVTPTNDTLLKCDALVMDIGLRKIFKSELQIRELSFEGTKFHYADTVSKFDIRADVEELRLQARPVNIIGETAILPDITLRGGDVSLTLPPSAPDTASTASTFAWAFKVANLQLEDINYKMLMLPDAMSLDCGLKKGAITDAMVDIGRQQVSVGYVGIDGVQCSYLYSKVDSEAEPPVAETDTAQVASLPWTIQADSLSLSNASATYGYLNYTPKFGFDPQYISVTGLNLKADSVYNRASEVRLSLRHLSFRERCGFGLTGASGRFSMDSLLLSLHDFILTTRLSNLKVDAEADASILSMNPSAPFSVKLMTGVAFSDAEKMFPSISSSLGVLPVNRFEAEADISGTLSDINVRKVSAGMPGFANLAMAGKLYGITGKRPSGDIILRGGVSSPSVFFSDAGNGENTNSVAIPDSLGIAGRFALRNDSIATTFNIRSAGGGSIRMTGMTNYKSQTYEFNAGIRALPLGEILPGSGLGNLSMRMSAVGENFDIFSPDAYADITLRVDEINYLERAYRDIEVTFNDVNRACHGKLISKDAAAPCNLEYIGMLSDTIKSIRLTGSIGTLNMGALGITRDSTLVNTQIDIGAIMAGNDYYSVKGGLGQTQIKMFGVNRTLPGLDIDFVSDTASMKGKITAEQISVEFSSPEPLMEFISGLDSAMTCITAQLDSMRLDAEQINSALPPFRLSARIGENPILRTYLMRNDMELKGFNLDFRTGENKPFGFLAGAFGFTSGDMSIDTVGVFLRQDTAKIKYGMYISNTPIETGQTGDIKLYGDIAGRSVGLNLWQQLKTGETGFRLGGRVSLDTASVRLEITPLNPIIGYSTCTVNPGNYVEYFKDGSIAANLKIISGEKLFNIYTENGEVSDELGVKLASLDISSLLEIWPLAPPVGGLLSSDLRLSYGGRRIFADGTISIDGFTYNKRLVGDVALDMDYSILYGGVETISLGMDINERNCLLLSGEFDTTRRKPMNVSLVMDSIPLESVNPFIPEEYATLTGGLSADLSVTGKSDDFKMNGYMQFNKATLTSATVGTTFALSPWKVSVTDNLVTFNNFGMVGPNGSPLNIDGTISFGDMPRALSNPFLIKTDLSISANNFQLVNVKKNNKSTVYGKAYANMAVNLSGPVNFLKVSGDVSLLNGTEITYTMRESNALGEEKDVSDLVQFESFNDTLNYEFVKPLPPPPWGMDMTVNVSIGQAVKLAVNITPDGKTGINLQGGGNLLYTMNMLGDTRFSGRYNISGGTVRYTPPIISTKDFDINQGSYVDWTGNIADPSFNITASQKIKTSVNEGGTSRLVTFYVIISIKNTLDRMAISFNLTAPDDMTITNELAAMTEEQRSEQALSMLLYNTYTGGSNTDNSFNDNVALNTFLQKELNQWARNSLKNVDLSFGVDSYKNASGEDVTDYSYQLSKSLFNDRFKVVVGGSYNPDISPTEVAQNIIGDVTLEYQLDERDNMLIKVFRSMQNDILEGNITEYGVGFAVRKQVIKLKELFNITGRKAKIEAKKQKKAEEKKNDEVVD